MLDSPSDYCTPWNDVNKKVRGSITPGECERVYWRVYIWGAMFMTGDVHHEGPWSLSGSTNNLSDYPFGDVSFENHIS